MENFTIEQINAAREQIKNTRLQTDQVELFHQLTGELKAALLLSKIFYFHDFMTPSPAATRALESKLYDTRLVCLRDGHYWLVKARYNWLKLAGLTVDEYDAAISFLRAKDLVVVEVHKSPFYKYEKAPHIRLNWPTFMTRYEATVAAQLSYENLSWDEQNAFDRTYSPRPRRVTAKANAKTGGPISPSPADAAKSQTPVGPPRQVLEIESIPEPVTVPAVPATTASKPKSSDTNQPSVIEFALNGPDGLWVRIDELTLSTHPHYKKVLRQPFEYANDVSALKLICTEYEGLEMEYILKFIAYRLSRPGCDTAWARKLHGNVSAYQQWALAGTPAIWPEKKSTYKSNYGQRNNGYSAYTSDSSINESSALESRQMDLAELNRLDREREAQFANVSRENESGW